VPFSKDDLLREMNAAGVHRVVTVPPGYEGERNDLVLEAARLHPDRFAIMGRINAEAPESRGVLATWRRQPGMLGLRLSFWRKIFRPILAEGRADWLWEEAEEASVPIMVFVDHEQVRFIDRVADSLRLCYYFSPRSAGKHYSQSEESWRCPNKQSVVNGRLYIRRPSVRYLEFMEFRMKAMPVAGKPSGIYFNRVENNSAAAMAA